MAIIYNDSKQKYSNFFYFYIYNQNKFKSLNKQT